MKIDVEANITRSDHGCFFRFQLSIANTGRALSTRRNTLFPKGYDDLTVMGVPIPDENSRRITIFGGASGRHRLASLLSPGSSHSSRLLSSGPLPWTLHGGTGKRSMIKKSSIRRSIMRTASKFSKDTGYSVNPVYLDSSMPLRKLSVMTCSNGRLYLGSHLEMFYQHHAFNRHPFAYKSLFRKVVISVWYILNFTLKMLI